MPLRAQIIVFFPEATKVGVNDIKARLHPRHTLATLGPFLPTELNRTTSPDPLPPRRRARSR